MDQPTGRDRAADEVTRTIRLDPQTALAVHHEDEWFYFLGDTGIAGHLGPETTADDRYLPHADGSLMRPAAARYWWRTDHEAEVITVRRARSPETVAYRLRNPAAESEAYPAELPVDEWHERTSDEAVYDLYRAVQQDRADEVVTVIGPWTVLHDELPHPGDWRQWTASLPYMLTYRPEYAHLFPGRMSGLHKHLERALAELPDVVRVYPVREFALTGIKVVLDIPTLEPGTWDADLRPGKTRRARPRATTRKVRRELLIHVGDVVEGLNRAEAAGEWDRLTAACEEAVREAGVQACPTCEGAGHVRTGPNVLRPHERGEQDRDGTGADPA